MVSIHQKHLQAIYNNEFEIMRKEYEELQQVRGKDAKK